MGIQRDKKKKYRKKVRNKERKKEKKKKRKKEKKEREIDTLAPPAVKVDSRKPAVGVSRRPTNRCHGLPSFLRSNFA